MTSANYSDEPIIYNGENADKLAALVDARLEHNREILHLSLIHIDVYKRQVV